MTDKRVRDAARRSEVALEEVGSTYFAEGVERAMKCNRPYHDEAFYEDWLRGLVSGEETGCVGYVAGRLLRLTWETMKDA